MILLVLAGLAAVFAACSACYLAGHAAGRAYGQSEAFDDAVMQQEAYLEALRRVT